MSKMWVVKFDVQAMDKVMEVFPVDMLRYDRCTPDTQEDIADMVFSVDDPTGDPRVITLVHYSHGDKKWLPTYRRWQSFGWRVVKVHHVYSV